MMNYSRNRYWLLLALLISPFFMVAQEIDSLGVETDTLQTEEVTEKKEKKPGFFNFKADYPNPKKAVLLSLMLPGTGQLYNKSYWKMPLVYGALGGMILVVDFNQTRYRRFRDALNLKRQDMEHEFTNTQLDDANTLRNLRDTYDKRTQTSYIFTVIVYGLQAMEAFVDAHLKGFDVDDDLSIRIKPTFEPTLLPDGFAPGMGIGIAIPLHRPVEVAPTIP